MSLYYKMILSIAIIILTINSIYSLQLESQTESFLTAQL